MTGDLVRRKTGPKPRSVADRFWEKVDKNGPVHPILRTRCWLWHKSARNGYGAFGERAGVTRGAHCVAYELQIGPIPDGKWVLHHCDVKRCVRGRHLFAGTPSDNTNDGYAKGRIVAPNSRKTRCVNGHEFSPANTRYNRDSSRRCVTCGNESSRRKRAKAGTK